ncbi:MAG TPA: hypothetical protein VGF14_02920 [Alphaproteobacteria bacterium]
MSQDEHYKHIVQNYLQGSDDLTLSEKADKPDDPAYDFLPSLSIAGWMDDMAQVSQGVVNAVQAIKNIVH